MVTLTPNYSLELVDFDTVPWHTKEHDNWRTIDAVFSNFVVVNNMQGVWQNSDTVAVGEKYVDGDLGTIFTCLIAHTTPSTGTFAASRTATSSNWETFTVQISNAGTWATSTAYSPNDFVIDGARYGIVQAAYTSSTTYDIDVTAGNIITLIDAGGLISESPVATTVAAGGSATVSFDSDTGIFTFGLVTGATGATGASGGGSGDLVASNNLSDVGDLATAFATIKQAASATATGVIEIATDDETNLGTATDRAITPANLAQYVTGATTATITSSDEIVFADVGSSNAKKKTTVQGILDLASGFASGTLMLFQQTNAPTGWTKETTHNNVALRVVSGTPSTGGATDFDTVFGSGINTGSHQLGISEIPAHTHTHAGTNETGSGGRFTTNDSDLATTGGSSGGNGTHSHTMSLDVKYLDLIICSKD